MEKNTFTQTQDKEADIKLLSSDKRGEDGRDSVNMHTTVLMFS